MADMTKNLAEIRSRVTEAARRAGRDPDEITLVAVSKTQPMSAIVEAAKAGQVAFGENRFEELNEKVQMEATLGLDQLEWHFIGTIQSRKTKSAIGPATLIHSVDRLKIAQNLSRDAVAANCDLAILFQLNISGEESKHGFSADELLAAMPELVKLPKLRIEGIMTMAPYSAEPEETRAIFRKMRELRAELRAAWPAIEFQHLSMGMTNDFELAIEEGATIIRVGSAIFGQRDYTKNRQQ